MRAMAPARWQRDQFRQFRNDRLLAQGLHYAESRYRPHTPPGEYPRHRPLANARGMRQRALIPSTNRRLVT
jgi:hypothetical protein